MNIMQFFRRRGMDGKAAVCLMILVLSIICGVCMLIVTSSRFSETMESHNQGILDSYAQIINERMLEVDIVSYNLRTEELITELMKTEKITAHQQLRIVRLLERLPEEMAQYMMISDYFIYFGESEKILTSTGFYDAYLFYKAFLSADGVSYEEWKKKLSSLQENGEYITEHKGIISSGIEDDYVLHGRKVIDENGRWMSCLIMIANDTLEKKCIGAAITGEGHMGLYGNKGEVIVEAAEGAVLYNGSDYEGGKNISVLSIKSLPQYNMKLVLAMPNTIFTSVLWNSYRMLRNVIVIMIALILWSGTMFVYINYARPKNSLLAWLREKKHTDIQENGYEYIRESLDEMLDAQNRELERERKIGQKILGEAYLLNLLRGHEEVDAQLKDALTSYGVELPWQYVCVILYESNTEEIVKSKSILGEIDQMIRSSIASPINLIPLNRDEKRNIVLMNMENYISQNEMSELISNLEKWVMEAQLYSLCISIGSQERIEEMAHSYQSAGETSKYHFMYPKKAVLESNMILPHVDKYVYPSEIENELIQVAANNRLDEVMRILNQIFVKNFEKRCLSIQFTKLLLYALLNTVYKVEAVKKSEEKILYQEPPDRLVMSSRDIHEAREQIEFIFRSLCEDNEEQQMQDASWRMKRIIRYINDHYLESDLSLEQVADHFRITPQYLSGLFKKNFNKNFSVHITLLRLENAKKLMADKRLTLTEVANRSGFNNYLALARAFQKYESQTPGEYRNRHFGS